jgi:hypothetical protein
VATSIITSKLHNKVLKSELSNDKLLAGQQNHDNDDNMVCNNILSSEDAVLFDLWGYQACHVLESQEPPEINAS